MTRPSRIAKRLLAPVLLAATLVVAVQVVLAAPPTASFTASGPGGSNTCGLWTFTSTASDPDGDITSTTWTIDGNVSTGTTATAMFGAGSHSATMTVTDGVAGDGDLGPEIDTAGPTSFTAGNGGPPNAAFTANPNPAQPSDAVTFNGATSSAQGGGSITRYEWDLNGDGTYETDTGATATASQSFATNGFHPVNLRVTDNCNGTDTVTGGGVFVQNTAPTASFTVTPNPAAIGATVTFDGSTSADPGGSIASYAWDLDGNGTFETAGGPTVTRQYTASGSYFVKLQVTDNAGQVSATAFDTLRVNAAPVASFSYSPVTPVIGEQVTFNGTTSSDPDGTIASYAWDLDGNGSFETNGATPTRTYSSAGVVNVKLRVTDSDNTQSAVVNRDVTIQATRPNARLTFAPANPVPGQAITLRSASTPSASAGSALVATQWDLNYSPTAEFTLDRAGASIVTSFATPGPHTVAVKVTETGGGYAIATATIPVNAPPRAAFTISPTKPREGREVTFASTSSDPDGPLVKQEWDLNNDGKFERTGAVVSTTKLKKGNRRIGLRVTDSKGATATTTPTVKVGRKPLRAPLDVVGTVSYLRRSWGIAVTELTVRVQSKTLVTVTCKGRGCPRGTFRQRSKKKRALLTFRGLKGNLRTGTKINIVFKRPGHITGWDVFTVRGQKAVLREGCKLASAPKKQKRCP